MNTSNPLKEQSYFNNVPLADISRSTFKRDFSISTTFNPGYLIPLFWDEILPNDTYEINTRSLVRMMTPIHPTIDESYLDIFYFYVPYRLVWEHYREFFGENRTSSWTPNVTYTIPQMYPPYDGWSVGSVANYLGVPSGYFPDYEADGPISNASVSALPFRAYALIWNEWFRSTSTQDPILVNLGDTDQIGLDISSSDSTAFLNSAARGGDLAPVNRLHDYFSSCLPQPQFGEAVAPIEDLLSLTPGSFVISNKNGAWTVTSDTDGKLQVASTGADQIAFNLNAQNFGVDASGLTVNDLRLAFQTQKLLERMAIGGTRYRELIYNFFGIAPSDSTVQIPELIGSARMVVGMKQVLQTSQTSTNSPLGETAAYSLTVSNQGYVNKSFAEPGLIMCCCCVRPHQSYQQGLERQWSRKDRLEFYNPVFANIGNTPVYKREIYATGVDEDDAAVFGYQEAWADYRYKPSRVTGFLQTAAINYGGTLDSWHYADFYEDNPTLSADWMRSPGTNIDRTVAVSSELSHIFLGQFSFDMKVTRAMPVYSIPGLLDHH